jgi:heme exporter protein D
MLALLATLAFAISGIVLIAVLVADRLHERRRRALAREERDRREHERLARYGEHLAAQNSRPHTNAVTHIATRHRQ